MAILNTQYYTNLVDRINGVNSCQALQDVTTEALQALSEQQAAITEQMAAIQPMLALLNPPTSLNAIISWIGNFITSFITPAVKPYVTYQAQLVALTAQIAQVVDAIQNAKLKFPNCTITPPGP